MKKLLKTLFSNLFFYLAFDKISVALNMSILLAKIKRYEKVSQCNINFVSQGDGGLSIIGDATNFYIASTSHLKSNTYIECIGGVSIGEYFHTGRDLTILSSNHNYESSKIPYDETYIKKPVIIMDYVWCGIGVKILPGVTIGEGAIIGMGSVVTKDIPKCAIVGGNPAKILKFRNKEKFEQLKQDKAFY